MHKIPVGILGASGYAGRELAALVAGHPDLDLAFAAANAQAGRTVRVGGREIRFVAGDDVALDRAALVFSALPHGASAEWVARAQSAGARVVDLSADLRPTPERPIGGPVPYGLPEALRARLDGAGVVANPGCYPTAILLALQPLAVAGLIRPGATIVADAASGVTGAGMAAKPELLFGEITENYRAYGVGNEHRHLAEMTAMLAAWDVDADLLFTPHLLPVARGILATITVPLAEPLGDDPARRWRECYADEPFVEVASDLPELRDVVRRNVVRLAVRPVANVRTPTVTIVAAIDNLVKGAAGQALQNANLLLGLPETAGLPR